MEVWSCDTASEEGFYQLGLAASTTTLFLSELVKEWECPDGDSGEDLAAEVRKYFIPDFTRWKEHDAFEEAYKRLLKDLRADQDAKV